MLKGVKAHEPDIIGSYNAPQDTQGYESITGTSGPIPVEEDDDTSLLRANWREYG